MFVELRMQTAMPPEVIAQCEAMLEQRDFKGIFNVVKEDDSFFSRVLVTGHHRIAQRPERGPRGHGARRRHAHHRNGKEDQHDGRAGHAGADDRAVGHAQGDDRQLQRDRHVATRS